MSIMIYHKKEVNVYVKSVALAPQSFNVGGRLNFAEHIAIESWSWDGASWPWSMLEPLCLHTTVRPGLRALVSATWSTPSNHKTGLKMSPKKETASS